MFKSTAQNQTTFNRAPAPRMHQTMLAQDFSYKKQAPIDSIKGQMQREAHQKINLVSEKKELEFLIEDQKEAQETLRNEFDRLTRDKKVEIERLDQINNDLEMETEKESKRREVLNQEVGVGCESYIFVGFLSFLIFGDILYICKYFKNPLF